ncbi:MAG: peptidoglycan-binding protein [Christensenellales bacterium]|jgi:SH3-like domain-containing protein
MKKVLKLLMTTVLAVTMLLGALPASAVEGEEDKKTDTSQSDQEGAEDGEKPADTQDAENESDDEEADESEEQTPDHYEPKNNINIATIIEPNVNIRETNDPECSVMFTLPYGSSVRLLEVGGEWSQVEYGGFCGFVRNDLMFSDALSKYCFVKSDGVYMRSEPNMDSEDTVLKSLPVGTSLDITSYSNEWFGVSDGVDNGYIHSSVVIVSKNNGNKYLDIVLFKGMMGQAVVDVQAKLAKKGFFDYVATGDFQELTEQAVIEFQEFCKLSPTGIVGASTFEKLDDINVFKPGFSPFKTVEKKSTSGSSSSSGGSGSSSSGGGGGGGVKPSSSSTAQVSVNGVIKLGWNAGAANLVGRGGSFIVTDVYSRISFNVTRVGGYLHWDAEPTTQADTSAMLGACGGWSWARRPIWVTVGGKTYAASMNCMPHGGDKLGGNGFGGVFCIHFAGSQTHPEGGTRQAVCPQHQACVDVAFNTAP